MLYWFFAIGFIFSVGCFAAGNNQVNIQVESLSYTRPDENYGDGGRLVFPEVRLTWDDMQVNLKNEANALDAIIMVRPTYLRFQTPGSALSLPLDEESSFFAIEKMELLESFILLNRGFLNFDGKYFQISDGTNILTLDKFNASCIGNQNINMTSLDGLIEGCLTELILNGKNDGDLAGAKLEYKGSGDLEFYFKSRLKEFKLHDNLMSLDLNTANLSISDYSIDIGKSMLTCEKDSSVKSFEDNAIDKLYVSCIDSVSVDSPEVEINNKVTGSSYAVKFKEAKTSSEQFYANIEKVGIRNGNKITELNNVVVDCLKYEGDEFFDLHKVLSSCFKSGSVTVEDMIKMKSSSSENESFWSSWFSGDDESSDENRARNITLTINDHKAVFRGEDIKVPYLPKSNVKVEMDIYHHNVDGEDKYIELKIKKVRMGILGGSGWVVKVINWAIDFFVDQDNVSIDGKKVRVYL